MLRSLEGTFHRSTNIWKYFSDEMDRLVFPWLSHTLHYRLDVISRVKVVISCSITIITQKLAYTLFQPLFFDLSFVNKAQFLQHFSDDNFFSRIKGLIVWARNNGLRWSRFHLFHSLHFGSPNFFKVFVKSHPEFSRYSIVVSAHQKIILA